MEKRNKTLTMSEIMTPEHANFAGNIHGGYILKLIDQAAYACAARYCGKYVVTLSVDKILFKKPIHVGELVLFKACVNYVGRTSLEVGVKVIAQNLMTLEERHTNSCYVTMVAVDEAMQPTRIPPLTIDNATEQRRYDEASLRRELNKKFLIEHKKMKQELLEKLKKS